MGSAPGAEYSSASSLDTKPVPGLASLGAGLGDLHTGSAVRAQSNTDNRYPSNDLLMGGSGRHTMAGGIGSAGGATGIGSAGLQPRQSSPMPQAGQALIMRTPPNVRGMSPSPMRNLAGLDSAYLQRSGSPVASQQQQHASATGASPGSVAPGLGNLASATRGISGAPVASLDGSPGGSAHNFWPSPRTASPNSGVYRAGEGYSRGRSHTRTLMPTQLVGGYSQSPTPAGVLRTASPGQVSTRATGIAWSPVPPSPPAPKRSISPQPSNAAPTMSLHPTSSPIPRWNSPALF